jgi:hypothetical protein
VLFSQSGNATWRLDPVATGGYLLDMAEMKTVGVKELKDNLSAYLREVRRGVRILVSDRSVVIAELREPGTSYGADESLHPLLEEWVRKGLVRLPTRPKTKMPPSPLRLPNGTATRLLDEERGDR